MIDLGSMFSHFYVREIYSATHEIAAVVASSLAPILLIISIHIRLMETQLNALTGEGRHGKALRDVIGWGFVLGAYFAIGNIITAYANDVYAWTDSFGSIKGAMDVYEAMMKKNQIGPNSESIGLTDLVDVPYALFVELIYYVTLVILAALSFFLKLAAAMSFGVAFIWGLIAIPISISTTFKILRGWALLLGFTLVWPIVECILISMITIVFKSSAEATIIPTGELSKVVIAANLKMLFAIMNLVLCAVLVAAPLIANALVSNTSAAAGIVMPFVGAAVAAGGAVKSGFQSFGKPKPPGPGQDKGPNPSPRPKPNPLPQQGASGARPQPQPQPQPQAQAGPQQPSSASAQQSRRGAIVNAIKKASGNSAA